MKYQNLTKAESFKKLSSLAPEDIKKTLSPERVSSCNIALGDGLVYNYAAMPVNSQIIEALSELAKEQELIEKYKAVLSGQIMNPGENRQVLHHLTRGRVLETKVNVDSEEKGNFYQSQLEKIEAFSYAIRSGAIVGSTGKAFDTVVQIGIGGSDLGPRALYIALDDFIDHKIKARFISNVDPDDEGHVLKEIDFETTLFVLVSKSGTTLETLTNQQMVIEAMKAANIANFNPSKHFVAVTSKTSPLAKSDDVLDAFFIDDYIGGRYSSSSAVGGVILSIAFGYEIFSRVLKGMHDADVKALSSNILDNAALMDALIGIYLRNVLDFPYSAVLPYSQALSRFPAHLQQLDMESNGKHVNREGKAIDYKTGPVIFGEPGTNGQHSFYQLLHQGTDAIPMQFIGFKNSQIPNDVQVEGSTSQQKLNANLVAQIVAFARGKDDSNANKMFDGNRYSSLIVGNQLTPEALGALLAHFENKVMFQGFVWNINSFDQEGVQLGKVLAKKVLSGCEDDPTLFAYASIFDLGK